MAKKVAIVCDWLTNQGGGERVVLELHRMFPDAAIFTSVYDSDGPGMDKFQDADIRQSFIRFLPWAKSKYQLYPVLRRWAFTRFDFSGYDLVISSSGAEAKAVKVPEGTTHINFCHSPTHYYWVRPDEYLKSDTMGAFGKLLRFGLKLLLKPMRRLDYLAAQRPDIMVANSTLTQDRIKRYYDRDSEVIFPPVDVERFAPPDSPPARKGFVSLGRQVHYMRRDIAVEACTQLGLLLRVIGRGPEHEYLRSIAGHTVEFYEDLSDQEVAEALWHAEGLISCGIEDFGITSAEALAAGCPVVALRGGGTQDIVEEDRHGVYFDEQTAGSLQSVLVNFNSTQFESQKLLKQADKFSVQNFQRNIKYLVDNL